MNDPQRDDAFERRVTGLLRSVDDDPDAATRAALLRARRRAVAAAAARRPAWRYLAPAGAGAALLLASLLFMNPGLLQQRGETSGPVAGEDLDLFTDAEAWEIAQEPDLGFIEWAAAMARQQEAGS